MIYQVGDIVVVTASERALFSIGIDDEGRRELKAIPQHVFKISMENGEQVLHVRPMPDVSYRLYGYMVKPYGRFG